MDPDTFLDTIYSLIRANYPAQPEVGLNAARLGFILKSQTGLDWTQLGYPKLSAVLAELERRGQLRVGPDAKGSLSVWLAEPVPKQIAGRQRGTELKRLRPPIWNAFIRTPLGRPPLVNQKTGEVWILNEPPAGGGWVEVEPIPQAEQQEWARDALRELGFGDDVELTKAVDDPNWYVVVPEKLRTKGPSVAAGWNRTRSERVRAKVEEWCQRTGVPTEVVLEPLPFRWAAAEPRSVGAAGADVQLRELLVAAVTRMSIDELLSLSIPARHLVSVLRPDLLDARAQK